MSSSPPGSIESSNEGGGSSSTKRQLRDRKERKAYVDDWALGDDELEGKRSFSLQEKLESDSYTSSYVKEMQGSDFTITYLQRHGFNTPLLFKDKTGLGLHVPSQNFTVNDVRTCVGSRRMLDVMDVSTQKNFEMSMKEWQRYYEEPAKDKLLNVISLEFSHTKLENYVHSPSIVRQIDWVDCVWPRHLKDAQTEATNVIDDMYYPKVQKYCLMSVKGCYTDFHIDFGGSSVWYHILRGSKVFWLIPPTEHNIKLFEQWVLSGKQQDIFFGDTVERCSRIVLVEGNTFFIPTGWIHAVYTPKDSLVFGGNFLHSYGIDKQIRVAVAEETTKVPQKFRYPFFTEMLWYVLVRYVHVLLGHSHIRDIPECEPPTKHIHLTTLELHGIKAIVAYLHSLPNTKKNIPELIMNPVALIKDVRTLVEQHRHDMNEYSFTGFPVLCNPDFKYGERRLPMMKSFGLSGHGQKVRRVHSSGHHHDRERGHHHHHHHSSSHHHHHHHHHAKGPSLGAKTKAKAGPRRRRTRCKKCAACHQSDCGECVFCQDMVKFGGSGRAKQTCIMRQCLQPMLPVTAACSACGLDGWGQQLALPVHKLAKDAPSSLMECSVCYEIIHPDCVEKICPDSKGQVNEDLPNSWECPKCVRDGKNNEYRPRHFRARRKWGDQRRKSANSEGGGGGGEGGGGGVKREGGGAGGVGDSGDSGGSDETDSEPEHPHHNAHQQHHHRPHHHLQQQQLSPSSQRRSSNSSFIGEKKPRLTNSDDERDEDERSPPNSVGGGGGNFGPPRPRAWPHLQQPPARESYASNSSPPTSS